MPKQPLNGLLRHLRKIAAVHTNRESSDSDLLDRFVGQRDETAFTVLIERHGPMVLGVCRRALPSFHDAEDACQATFLVLARKAASVRKKTSLSSWLHGVACRVAANLKREQARRTTRERGVHAPASVDPAAEVSWREVQTILDEELKRLPDRYRAPIILCYLECMTRDEVAKQLGLSSTTLHGRLERARNLLRESLAQRGLTLGTVMSAAAFGDSTAQAALSPVFAVSSIKAAMLLAAGQPFANNVLGTQVLALTQEVIKSMFLTKLKLRTATLLAAGFFMATVVGSFTSLSSGQDARPETAYVDGVRNTQLVSPMAQPSKTKKGSGTLFLEGMDLVNRSIKGSRVDTNPERTFFSHRQVSWELLVKPTTKITIDGKDAKLADLQKIKPPPGDDSTKIIFVEAEFEVADGPRQSKRKGLAIRIDATGMQRRGVVQTINVGKNTLTFKKIGHAFDGDVVYGDADEASFAKNAQVTINDRAATLGDLKPNMKVALQMSAVNELVLGIKAYGATVKGVLKTVDAAKNAVSVTIPSAQMTAEGVSVAKNAKVIIDGKEARLSDLKAGMQVTLRMSAEPDQSVIIAITMEKAR